MGNVARKQGRGLGGARGCEMSRRAVCVKFLCVGVCAGVQGSIGFIYSQRITRPGANSSAHVP